MQSKTKNFQTRDRIEALLAGALPKQALASGPEAVRELRDGWFNALYALRLADGRELVLKIAPADGVERMRYERNIMRTEVAVMRLLQDRPGVPLPAILAYEDSRRHCDADYFLMEYLPGVGLDQALQGLDAAAQAKLEQESGRIVRAVNEVPGDYFGYPGNPALRAGNWREAFAGILEAVLEDASDKRADCGHDPAEIRALLRRHAATLDEVEQPRLLHWDAWSKNFIVDGGRIRGLIDFERALWGDPLMEVQFRPLLRTGVSEAMRGYGKTVFSAAERRRCALYSLYLALVMNTECHYRHYDSDEIDRLSRRGLDEAMAALREGVAA